MKGIMLPRPVLKLRRGTAITPFDGFKLGFGPYCGPSEINVAILSCEEYVEDVIDLYCNLKDGKGVFNGMEKWFNIVLPEDPKIISVVSEEDLTSNVSRIPKCDLVLVAVPDDLMVEYDDDPYMPLKREIAKLGIPSQMLEYSTVKNLKDNPYVLFNLALSVYSKVGGIPWILAEPTFSELVIGLEVRKTLNERIVAGVSVLSMKNRFRFNWSYSTVDFLRAEQISFVIRNELKDVVCEEDVQDFTFHYEGMPSQEVIDGIKKALNDLVDENMLSKDYSFRVVAVKKGGTPKIFKAIHGSYGVPDKGFTIILDYYRGIVATSGFPEFSFHSPLGLVRPLKIEVVDENCEHDIKEVIKEVYWLSELHWASGFRSSKYPISTLYAHRIVQFVASGVEPPEEYRGKAWFL